MTHKLDRSVVTATSAPSGNQIWLSPFSRSVFTFQKNVNTPFFFCVNHLFFFFFQVYLTGKKTGTSLLVLKSPCLRKETHLRMMVS